MKISLDRIGAKAASILAGASDDAITDNNDMHSASVCNTPTYAPELERLMDIIITDGEVTDIELRLLREKAAKCEVDPDEIELVLFKRLKHMNQPGSSGKDRTVGTRKLETVAELSQYLEDLENVSTLEQVGNYASSALNVTAAFGKIPGLGIVSTVSDEIGSLIDGRDKKRRKKISAIRSYPTPSDLDGSIEFLSFLKSYMITIRKTDKDLKDACMVRYNEILSSAERLLQSSGHETSVLDNYRIKKTFKLF